MHLLGRNILSNLQKNAAVDKWLTSWICEVVNAHWKNSDQVFKQFPQAQQLNDNLFLFETKPKMYCIKVQIAFPKGIVLITALNKLMENNNE
jgi:mRNA interferase HigB